MDKWQDAVTYFMPVIVFMGIIGMLKPILAPELEKKLGRKLTDWDWEYYRHEIFRKLIAELQEEKDRQRLQRLDDMKIIHDMVWKNT
jgi:hypothetical protein